MCKKFQAMCKKFQAMCKKFQAMCEKFQVHANLYFTDFLRLLENDRKCQNSFVSRDTRAGESPCGRGNPYFMLFLGRYNDLKFENMT